MRAVLLTRFSPPKLVVEDIPVPKLHAGQVLIKMEAAPINPSDLVFLRNLYGIQKHLPVVPGFEGSGTVIQAKGGIYGRWLVGKRVACHAPETGNGTWAEYMATSSESVIPLLQKVSFDQGASFMINPLTAWTLVSMAKEQYGHGFVQTAAASALGLMMERLGHRWGLRSINIVRRREQVEYLKTRGAHHVLDSTEHGWEEQLRVLCAHHKIRLAFDAVGGDLTARMAAAMPKGTKVIVYGALSGENFQMSPSDLIFQGKSMEGFWLTEWIKKMGFRKKVAMAAGVQEYLATDLSTNVQARYPLDQAHKAIALYKQQRTEGKVLLIP